jgi:hypothetical protein
MVGVALFGRRRSTPAQPSPQLPLEAQLPRDGTFAFFDVEQGVRFRARVREAFAEVGREVEVYADVVVDDRGSPFGLHNVAAACYNDDRGERAWAEVIRKHVTVITT